MKYLETKIRERVLARQAYDYLADELEALGAMLAVYAERFPPHHDDARERGKGGAE